MSLSDAWNDAGPELTAHAVGESHGAAREEWERRLASHGPGSEEIRRELEQIAALAESLRTGFARELEGVGRIDPWPVPASIPCWQRPGVWAAAAAVVLTTAGSVFWVWAWENSPAGREAVALRSRGDHGSEARPFRVRVVDPEAFGGRERQDGRASPGGIRAPGTAVVTAEIPAEGVSADARLFPAPPDPEGRPGDFGAGLVDAARQPYSSFRLEVRRDALDWVGESLRAGIWPAASTVRVEELVNRFALHGTESEEEGETLAIRLEAAECPWAPGHRLAAVTLAVGEAVRGREAAREVEVLVEFQPAEVSQYRLLGDGAREGGAGEPSTVSLRAGSAVTALYEWVPGRANDGAGKESPGARVPAPAYLTVRVAYQGAGLGREVRERHLLDPGGRWDEASEGFRAVTAAAMFGLKLREEAALAEIRYGEIDALVEGLEHVEGISGLRKALARAEAWREP